MRTLIIAAALLSASALAFASDDYVRGYFKKDGTYVAPHHKTKTDNKLYNNYSSEGQTNLYTGEKGSKRHEYSSTPTYQKSSPSYTPRYDSSPYGSEQPKRKSTYGW